MISRLSDLVIEGFRSRRIRHAAIAVVVVASGVGVLMTSSAPAQGASFAGRIADLSEPGGYFDTDNLISNERSYLHVAPALDAAALRGGAYVGVGPDQNFSYIARVRPAIAIIIDIRRDNMLLHLLFKALFELSRTRVEYLALLTGRSPPAVPAGWDREPVAKLVAYIDGAPRSGRAGADADRIAAAIRRYGVPLSDGDFSTIVRFHGRFTAAGLSLQFNSTGRPPQWGYPTYRDLLLETDLAGTERSFLASEADFQFVKQLQARHLVIPVVGDLAGPKALGAIGRFLAARRTPVSAFYTSNVEFYLFGDRRFELFVANLERLPRRDDALIVRSVFGRNAEVSPGDNSASLTQAIAALVNGHAQGRFRWYGDVIAASR